MDEARKENQVIQVKIKKLDDAKKKKKKNNEINSLAEELKGEKKKHMTAFSYSENSVMRGI